MLFGSPHFDTGYELAKASDGNPSTFWLGKCHPNSALGSCGSRPLDPPTSEGWIIGADLGSVVALASLAISFPGAAYRPTTASVQVSADDTAANADGSNIQNWTTAGSLPGGLGVTMTLTGNARHVRVCMSSGPGAQPDGEYQPGVSAFSVTTGSAPSSLLAHPAIFAEGRSTVYVSGASVAHGNGCYGISGQPSYGAQCGDQAWASWWNLVNLRRPRKLFVNVAIPGVGVTSTATGLNTPPWSSQVAARVAAGGAGRALIVWDGGCRNEVGVGIAPATVLSNYAAQLDALRNAGYEVAMVEVAPSAAFTSPSSSFTSDLLAIREGQRQIARERPDVWFCTVWDALRDHSNTSDLGAPRKDLAPDGTHFTQAGQEIAARIIATCLGWSHRMPGQ